MGYWKKAKDLYKKACFANYSKFKFLKIHIFQKNLNFQKFQNLKKIQNLKKNSKFLKNFKIFKISENSYRTKVKHLSYEAAVAQG